MSDSRERRGGRWLVRFDEFYSCVLVLVMADIALPFHQVADRENLQPMYEDIAQKVRAQDDHTILMYESVTWDDFLPVGFNSTPGGSQYNDITALSFHYYSNVNFNSSWQLQSRAKDANRLNWGGMLTEFDVPRTLDDATLMEADAGLLSWIMWEFKSYIRITGWSTGAYTEAGTPDTGVIAALARTYPQVVAGEVERFHYEPFSGNFTLAYRVTKATYGQETVVFIPAHIHYSSGYSVALYPPAPGLIKTTTTHGGVVDTATGEAPFDLLHIVVSGGQGSLPVGTTVTVTITRNGTE